MLIRSHKNKNMSEMQQILVGKIVGAQGLRGEVRVQTFTENPSDFMELKIKNPELKIKFVRALPSSDVVILKVDGVDDRAAAEQLRGTELFVARDALPRLPAGEFYYADLIGLRVGENTVAAVHNFGAGDILELDNGEMLSFAGAEVDLENRKISYE
jgi:16S rRNA processing protein RimM